MGDERPILEKARLAIVTGVIAFIIGCLTNLITIPYTQHVSDVSNRLKATQAKKEAEIERARLEEEIELERRLSFCRMMKTHMAASHDAFAAQVTARNRLYVLLERRHGPLPPNLHYEEVFRKYHSQFTEDEKILYQLIRGITRDTFYKRNKAMLEMLDDHPEYARELDHGKALREHLELWLTKYKELMPREDTCLIYVGVSDVRPYPDVVEAEVDQKLRELESRGGRPARRP